MNSVGNLFINFLLYVDDKLIAEGCKQEIDKLKGELSEKFEMKDLDATK